LLHTVALRSLQPQRPHRHPVRRRPEPAHCHIGPVITGSLSHRTGWLPRPAPTHWPRVSQPHPGVRRPRGPAGSCRRQGGLEPTRIPGGPPVNPAQVPADAPFTTAPAPRAAEPRRCDAM